mmetsp:Transcript_7010/g.6154  ORF Transcript_7010/g.6154 Transcript_7010/m.6154 type:complete len:210 (+) Transcript_7010:26-655(+)
MEATKSGLDQKIDQKYKEAKELPPADIKLILLGDSAVGKSKLVERFLLNDYEERTSSTHALTMYRHNTTINGVETKIDIWDTAGQESFNELHPSYYFGAHTCILVFDANRRITYQNLKHWYKEMKHHCPHIPCMVIANKIDIDDRATQRQYKFVEELGVPFNFVSAANGTNVVQIFKDALNMAQEYKKNPPKDDFMSEVMDLLGDKALE